MNTKQKVEVMLAQDAGQPIEVRVRGGQWKDWVGPANPFWNWEKNEYRVKVPKKWFCVWRWKDQELLRVSYQKSEHPPHPVNLDPREEIVVVQDWKEYQ